MTQRALTIVAALLVSATLGSGFSRIAASSRLSEVRPRPDATAAPIIVIETTKGTFTFLTYPADAPKTVAHVTALVKKGFYITLAPRPDLDGKYAIFGQIVEGEDVPAQLQVGDLITKAYVRE